jgi:hypothetical protein
MIVFGVRMYLCHTPEMQGEITHEEYSSVENSVVVWTVE